MHVLHSSQAGSTEGCQNQNVSIQNPCLFYVLWHGDKFPGNNFLKIFPLSSESMMNFPHWRREKTENSHQRHNGSRASLSQIFSSVLDIEERVCVCVCVCVWDYCFPLFSWPSTFAPVISWGLNSTLRVSALQNSLWREYHRLPDVDETIQKRPICLKSTPANGTSGKIAQAHLSRKWFSTNGFLRL